MEEAMSRSMALIILALFTISTMFAAVKLTPLENFDSGSVALTSWQNEDISPSSWSLDTATPDGSAYCLKLFGNTWKLQQITPYAIDSTGVIQVKVKTATGGQVQGIGFTDGVHDLFYSFSGTRIANIETWVPVYQGAFSSGVWQLYQLPLASDWQAFFGYLPMLSGIIYINDMDGVSNRSVYFDAIEDVSDDLPVPPHVIASQGVPTKQGKDVGIAFHSEVFDPDSNTFTYEWDFGDASTSNQPHPYHLFTVAAQHVYTVSLKVTDESGKCGYDTTFAVVDPSPESTMPVSMNFVGDTMLARRYEENGGIIPTQGVNAIFAPTKPIFGDAADISDANLEVVLSNTGTHHPTKSIYYRGNPSNISGLVFAGIDVVSLANNHTQDYGLSALQQMQGLLAQNGIKFSGAGANSYEAYLPTFINKRGLNIAFLRSCDRTGQYNDAQPYLQAGYNKYGFAYMTPYYMEQQLAAVQNVADLKIMELHGGSEYSLTPGSNYDKTPNPFLGDNEDEDYSERTDVPHQWDIAIRHTAIDLGADLVIVHHPHIIQGLEVYNGKLIAHSLGNFVFDLDYPETMPTMILYADADFSGFSNFRVKPVFIDDYIPRPATGILGVRILDYIASRSRELNTRVYVNRAEMQAEVIMDDVNPPVSTNAWSCYQQLTTTQGTDLITQPIKLPRSGSVSGFTAVEPQTNTMVRLGEEEIWFGDFESTGTSYWAPPQYSTTDVFDGARSALLTSTSASVTSTIPDRCKWYDNTKKYTLQGWMKTINATSANFQIRYYNNRTTGGVLSTENVTTNVSGNTEWTYYFKELTIPTNAYYYDIRLSLNGPVGSASALFDNIGLIEWTDYLPLDSLTDIAWPNNYYWMQAKTIEAAKSMYLALNEKEFYGSSTNEQAHHAVTPPEIRLYPNPFNPMLNIGIDLPSKAMTAVNIYNIKGQLVKNLMQGVKEAGKYQLSWDATDNQGRSVASGVYFIKVDNGGAIKLQKAILMK